ncbi:MAG: hypothetical protein WA213_20290 [Terriglobales bacterium]
MATAPVLTDKTREKLNLILREIYETYGQDLGKFLLNLPDEPEPSPEVAVEQSMSVLKKKG